MTFRQMFEPVSSSYSYLLASRRGGEALIIDPVLEKANISEYQTTKGGLQMASSSSVLSLMVAAMVLSARRQLLRILRQYTSTDREGRPQP